MAKKSSVDFLFEIDKADGGVLTSGLTPYITEFGPLKVSKGSVESTPFGASAAQFLQGVVSKYDPIVIKGFWDGAAEPAPDAVFNIRKYVHAVTRSFSLTIGTAVTGECWITDYEVTFTQGNYHEYSATIQMTGVIGEA
jgi:hypothetical protein